MNWFSLAILSYFLATNGLYLFLFLISFIALIRYHIRAQFATPNEILKAHITPPMSVLLPAYNESKTVVASVESLAVLNYPEYEIIVINDGSKDDTLDVLAKRFDLRKTNRVYHQVIATKPLKAIYRSKNFKRLTVIDKENGGKADSLNAGINVCTYPLFCSLDADSLLEKNALLRIVHPFMEAYTETVASGGIVRAANECRIENGEILETRLSSRWIVNFQVIEYLRAFLSGRMGWSLVNSLLVISGAFGVFKKEAVTQAGGYRHDTVGEDMELVVRLHRRCRESRKPYRFSFIPDPVCWTEVPESWKILARQRNRWQRGLAESLGFHIRMLFNPSYGTVGLFAMPYFFFIECLSPTVEMTGYFFFITALWAGAIAWETCYIFFLLAVFFGILFSLLAILMEETVFERYPRRQDLTRMILGGVAENFGYRQFLAFVRAKGLLDWARGKRAWGAMERKGFGPQKRP